MHFNIIGFGSTYEALFPHSRKYDDASLLRAARMSRRWRRIWAERKSSRPLQLALGQPQPPALARQVVVLTDGEVTNTDAVLALAAQHAATARIFTFGIGAGASHHLVKGLARAGGGAAEFIYPGERIEPKVVRQFRRLLSPALMDVRVEWGVLDVTQAPAAVPPVFAGGRLLLYGLVKEGNTPATLHLTATSAKVRSRSTLNSILRGGIRSDSYRARRPRTHSRAGGERRLDDGAGLAQRDRKASANRNEIVALSVRYGLMSRETSYVAMERRDIPVLGDVKLRRVPIALTSGWGRVTEAFMLLDSADLPQFCRADHCDGGHTLIRRIVLGQTVRAIESSTTGTRIHRTRRRTSEVETSGPLRRRCTRSLRCSMPTDRGS